MKVLIVDDEKPARDRLRRLLGGLSDYSVIADAANGHDAIALTETCQPDIILMDIRMPVMDGLEAARHISLKRKPPAIIFTTAFSDHALEAFETHAADYLLKPIRLERLKNALASCSRLNQAQMQSRLNSITTEESRKHICARVRGNLVLIALKDIYYFMAEQKYVTVRHVGGEVLIEEPLKSLEKEFSDEFQRIHRNALVRLEKVAGMTTKAGIHRVFFHDIDKTLEISRRHLSVVRKILKNM